MSTKDFDFPHYARLVRDQLYNEGLIDDADTEALVDDVLRDAIVLGVSEQPRVLMGHILRNLLTIAEKEGYTLTDCLRLTYTEMKKEEDEK